MVILENKYWSNLPKNFTGKTHGYNEIIFIRNNKWHRLYGPARIWYNDSKFWWFNGNFYGNSYYNKYNQKQFIKNLNRQWLL